MKRYLATSWACVLAACASHEAGMLSNETETLRSLERRQMAIERDGAVDASRAAAILAYRKFLDAAPRDRMRPEAMRRLGDLEVERAQDGIAESSGAKEYRDAVKVYENLLRTYPAHQGNDRVLYQLSHAYDQIGDLGRSLATLDRLVTQYPLSEYRDEAEFRRGEMLFTLRRYHEAEDAYNVILQNGEASTFHERALYMHGWSLFKQGRLEEGLNSFFAVLDRKLIGHDNGAALEKLPGLTRADRELAEDTFRVVSLSLANLRGPDTIPEYTSIPARREYEFRVYQQLGELYLKQERVEDGAKTFNAFARRYPTDPQAPFIQSRVIEAYQRAGFTALALEAKKEFVVRYGVKSEFAQVNGAGVYARVLPSVEMHLEELARHYHAAAQKTKKNADYEEAVRWYRVYLESFPTDPHAPGMNFLLADLLFEDKRFGAAATEYERTAYGYPLHEKAADAGYAALLAHLQYEKLAKGEYLRSVRKESVDSALRFAEANPTDARAPRVLTNTAERLYANNDPESAAALAQRVLALQPRPAPELRRTAWTVVAQVEFQQGRFDRSEKAYQEALALTSEKSSTRAGLTERLAASVYKQGEQARAAGQMGAAAENFLRVGRVAPHSATRVNAEYDAAAALIALKEWNAAARVLEDFRRNYPKHPLQAQVPGKLAVCYLESGQVLKAAAEFEALSVSKKDMAFTREALWQAAELYEKAGREGNAAAAYERYVRLYPTPLESAVEARYRLAEMYRKEGRLAQRQEWSRRLVEAEKNGGNERTDRTRYLGSLSALVMVEPLEQSYRGVRLAEPLKRNLKLKKDKMQQVLRAYSVAADYGVSEVATTATYRTAEIYSDFGKALLDSQRPKGLSKDELEQYNVLLEEQAYPFEEKAIELHEINARRVGDGLYDEWVRKSFAALGKLRPVRYGKSEKGEEVINVLH